MERTNGKFTKRHPVTDEERAALMKKLDDDLELFMEEMAAKKVSVFSWRFPFHFHFFAMKYDDVGEDKQINAERHRQEGNKHFKLKKYRWATDCYTEGRLLCFTSLMNHP
uniref:40S ribosomal protein S15 n=1 Tax=Angiostrongylus cantonensis TaxID=6313 RepID=A0A0K0D565_ANGCA